MDILIPAIVSIGLSLRHLALSIYIYQDKKGFSVLRDKTLKFERPIAKLEENGRIPLSDSASRAAAISFFSRRHSGHRSRVAKQTSC